MSTGRIGAAPAAEIVVGAGRACRVLRARRLAAGGTLVAARAEVAIRA